MQVHHHLPLLYHHLHQDHVNTDETPEIFIVDERKKRESIYRLQRNQNTTLATHLLKQFLDIRNGYQDLVGYIVDLYVYNARG